jgi:hypothetical protein
LDRDQLFLATLDDLEARLKPGRTEYDVLMIAALLRKLLLDGAPLVDQVNTSRRLKILFRANCETQVPPIYLEDQAIFWSQQDGFDPETARPRPEPPKEMGKDAMLRCVVLMTEGHTATVHEVVDYAAHIEGAVHPGSSRTPKDDALRRLADQMRVGGMAPGTRELLAIGRVILRGLEALRQGIREGGA